MLTNSTHIAETALLLLAAYLLGCVLGYGARRLLHAASAQDRQAKVPAPPKRIPSTAARLAARVENEPPPDNLRKIKGIGPKIESSLQALGIMRLEQIAGWTEADIARIDAQLSARGRIRRDRWVEQAQELIGSS